MTKNFLKTLILLAFEAIVQCTLYNHQYTQFFIAPFLAYCVLRSRRRGQKHGRFELLWSRFLAVKPWDMQFPVFCGKITKKFGISCIPRIKTSYIGICCCCCSLQRFSYYLKVIFHINGDINIFETEFLMKKVHLRPLLP